MYLLREVEKFLKFSNMPAARFGREAVKDPRFVFDLRNGREPRRRPGRLPIRSVRAAQDHRRHVRRPAEVVGVHRLEELVDLPAHLLRRHVAVGDEAHPGARLVPVTCDLTDTADVESTATIGFTEALDGVTVEEALQQVKTYYLKKKYLLRIQESLSKFASRS